MFEGSMRIGAAPIWRRAGCDREPPKRQFDIDSAHLRIRRAVRRLPKAAMFALAEEDTVSPAAGLRHVPRRGGSQRRRFDATGRSGAGRMAEHGSRLCSIGCRRFDLYLSVDTD
jgi:hypothetical protein